MERRELGVDAHQLHGRQVRLVESIAQRKGRLIASLLLLAIVAAIAALLL
jgi:hypothetical protein